MDKVIKKREEQQARRKKKREKGERNREEEGRERCLNIARKDDDCVSVDCHNNNKNNINISTTLPLPRLWNIASLGCVCVCVFWESRCIPLQACAHIVVIVVVFVDVYCWGSHGHGVGVPCSGSHIVFCCGVVMMAIRMVWWNNIFPW